jgi:hypothetical protein
MSRDTAEREMLGRADQDLSKLSAEGIYKLRDELIEQARRKVDPNGTGFDARMSIHDEFPWADDGRRFLEAFEAVIWIVTQGLTRLGLCIIAAGGAIAASLMFGNEAGSHYAGATLLVSLLFAIWFAISAAVATFRGKSS